MCCGFKIILIVKKIKNKIFFRNIYIIWRSKFFNRGFFIKKFFFAFISVFKIVLLFKKLKLLFFLILAILFIIMSVFRLLVLFFYLN